MYFLESEINNYAEQYGGDRVSEIFLFTLHRLYRDEKYEDHKKYLSLRYYNFIGDINLSLRKFNDIKDEMGISLYKIQRLRKDACSTLANWFLDRADELGNYNDLHVRVNQSYEIPKSKLIIIDNVNSNLLNLVMKLPIQYLNLGERINNILNSNNINTVKELLSIDHSYLRKTFGRLITNQILDTIRSYGLKV